MDIRIKGLAHVGIPTSDLEASRKFYESLGFRTLVYAPELEGNNFLFMECNGVIIGLPQSLDADTRALAGTKGAGDIDHFALYVDDIEATYEELKRRGCQFVTDGICLRKIFCFLCFFSLLDFGKDKALKFSVNTLGCLCALCIFQIQGKNFIKILN